MACKVIMDLKPIDSKFTYSKTEKSATLMCEFSGKRNALFVIPIELFVTSRSGAQGLKAVVTQAEKAIADGNLLRVMGTLHRMMYQERASGEEIDRLRVIALDVTQSWEKEPIFSIAQMEGGIRKVSDTDIVKDTGAYRKATFTLYSDPESNFGQETYLNVYTLGYGEVADWVNRLKVKDKSHVIASGRFEATSFGPICLKLHDLGYAELPKKEKKRSKLL